MSKSIRECLARSLDSMTPHYKGVLARLPKGERKLLCALCRCGGESAFEDLSNTARLGSRVTATYASRLSSRGLIHSVRRGLWAVSDKWMVHWYQFRHSGTLPSENPFEAKKKLTDIRAESRAAIDHLIDEALGAN